MGNQDMEAIKIKFGGDLHSVDANTFINTLLHFNTILQEANKSLSTDKKLNIRIDSTGQGSFVVDLSLHSSALMEGVKALFSDSAIGYMADLATVSIGVFSIAQFLKGKKAKNIERDKDKGQVTIENMYGDVNVYAIEASDIYLKNAKVMQAVSESMKTLDKDENINSFEISDKVKQKRVAIDREEFFHLANDEKLNVDDKKNLNIPDARLNISSLDLEFKKKWEFYYEGNKISAKICDDQFKESVSDGERFGKGDVLIADISIEQVFNKDVNAYVNKSYSIDSVKEHINKTDPPEIFDEL